LIANKTWFFGNLCTIYRDGFYTRKVKSATRYKVTLLLGYYGWYPSSLAGELWFFGNLDSPEKDVNKGRLR